MKVEVTNNCWTWKGSVDCNGHPVMFVKGRPMRTQHVAFVNYYGFKPKRVFTICGAKLCVRPEHLASKERTESRIQTLVMALGSEISTTERAVLENERDRLCRSVGLSKLDFPAYTRRGPVSEIVVPDIHNQPSSSGEQHGETSGDIREATWESVLGTL